MANGQPVMLNGKPFFGNASPLQSQLAAAQQQNASYQSQIAELQKSLQGGNVYRPSYTQGISQPVSYVPAQNSVSGSWHPSLGGIDALSRISASNNIPLYSRPAGGITSLPR